MELNPVARWGLTHQLRAVVGPVSDTARQAANSRQMDWIARIGLTARGVVYLLMGILALLIARGAHAEVDQKSVLAQVLAKPYGSWIVGLLAVGFASYALWRLAEAAFGVTGEGRTTGPRVQSLVRGMIYAFLSYTAISVLQGSRRTQVTQQQGYATDVMSHPGGRWVVGLVGLAIALVGLAAMNEGIRLRFMRFFPAGNLPPRLRAWIRGVGRIGTIGRGFVFTLTGMLVISAAWTHNAAKASGLDGALKTLRDRPFGGLLLGLAATGLIIFGAYGLAEARYRRV